MRTTIILVMLVSCLTLAQGAMAASSTNYSLPFSATSNGGGEKISTSYDLTDTAGESAIGVSSSTGYQLTAGYCGCVAGIKASAEEVDGQTWYSHSDDTMYKEIINKPSGTLTITDGESNLWLADEVAEVNVGFPAGTWEGLITLEETLADGEQFTVTIGSSHDSIITPADNGSQTLEGNGSDKSFSLSITADAFTVDTGDYLALQIDNPLGGSTGAFNIKTGLRSNYISSPLSDPGYPIPELPGIILLSLALAILGGYWWLRVWRRRSVVIG
jgi:hypothetical protein